MAGPMFGAGFCLSSVGGGESLLTMIKQGRLRLSRLIAKTKESGEPEHWEALAGKILEMDDPRRILAAARVAKHVVLSRAAIYTGKLSLKQLRDVILLHRSSNETLLSFGRDADSPDVWSLVVQIGDFLTEDLIDIGLKASDSGVWAVIAAKISWERVPNLPAVEVIVKRCRCTEAIKEKAAERAREIVLGMR